MEGVASAIGSAVNVDLFADVNVLITLTLNQGTFAVACQKFRDDVIRENLEVKITASLRTVFEVKVLGVNDLVGRIIGGLTNYLSETTTRGRDELLEKATLSSSDKKVLRDYFQRQIRGLGSELEKNSVRTIEAWTIMKFEELLRSSPEVHLIDFLSILFQHNQGAYDEFTMNWAMLHHDLKIGPPVFMSAPAPSAKALIRSSGVNDPEDVEHLASIYEYITPPSRKAVYVSTDYVDVIANQPSLSKLGIHCDVPIYAVDTYKALI